MEKLNRCFLLEIVPTKPFHFDSTFYKPGHFPTGDTKWEPGERWQTMFWLGERLGLIFEDQGTKQTPKVLVKVFARNDFSSEFLESLKKEIIWRYNLDLDLSVFYKALQDDLLLRPVFRRFHGLRPMHAGSLYEYLIVAIVLQNATVRRSVSMTQNLFEKYGTLLEFGGGKLWSFWEPKVLADEKEENLRKLKVGYRAKSLIGVSQSFAQGQINEEELRQSPVEDQEQTLLSLYGIGPASVGYILFDVFHRWGYLKHISPWEQKIYTHIFFNQNHEKKLVPVKKMLKYFDQWGPWKNLAVHYVWENVWWQRRRQHILWLEKLIRL